MLRAGNCIARISFGTFLRYGESVVDWRVGLVADCLFILVES